MNEEVVYKSPDPDRAAVFSLEDVPISLLGVVFSSRVEACPVTISPRGSSQAGQKVQMDQDVLSQ